MISETQSGPPMVEDDGIQERVLKVIATTKRLPRESVSAESTFEQLGIDSLDRLNILFDLESEFDIQINDEDAKKVENIPQMVAGVRQLVQAKGSEAPAAAVPAEAESKDAAMDRDADAGKDQASTAR